MCFVARRPNNTAIKLPPSRNSHQNRVRSFLDSIHYLGSLHTAPGQSSAFVVACLMDIIGKKNVPKIWVENTQAVPSHDHVLSSAVQCLLCSTYIAGILSTLLFNYLLQISRYN